MNMCSDRLCFFCFCFFTMRKTEWRTVGSIFFTRTQNRQREKEREKLQYAHVYSMCLQTHRLWPEWMADHRLSCLWTHTAFTLERLIFITRCLHYAKTTLRSVNVIFTAPYLIFNLKCCLSVSASSLECVFKHTAYAYTPLSGYSISPINLCKRRSPVLLSAQTLLLTCSNLKSSLSVPLSHSDRPIFTYWKKSFSI